MQLSLADAFDIGQKDLRKGVHVVQAWVRELIVSTTSTSLNRMTDLMRAFVLIFAFRSASPQPFRIHGLEPDTDERPPYCRVPTKQSFELHGMKEDLLNMVAGRKDWSPRPLICLFRYSE